MHLQNISDLDIKANAIFLKLKLPVDRNMDNREKDTSHERKKVVRQKEVSIQTSQRHYQVHYVGCQKFQFFSSFFTLSSTHNKSSNINYNFIPFTHFMHHHHPSCHITLKLVFDIYALRGNRRIYLQIYLLSVYVTQSLQKAQ